MANIYKLYSIKTNKNEVGGGTLTHQDSIAFLNTVGHDRRQIQNLEEELQY